MKKPTLTATLLGAILFAAIATSLQPTGSFAIDSKTSLRPNSHCTTDEHIIFNCTVKRTGKIVSLCSSKELTRQKGYLQYRFGLPGKVELEHPKARTGTQAQFHYTHYFRYQVDLTEINFSIDGFEYQIFDNYNGEEKRKITEEGVSVTAPGKPKQASFVCRAKATADYGILQDVLGNDQN